MNKLLLVLVALISLFVLPTFAKQITSAVCLNDARDIPYQFQYDSSKKILSYTRNKLPGSSYQIQYIREADGLDLDLPRAFVNSNSFHFRDVISGQFYFVSASAEVYQVGIFEVNDGSNVVIFYRNDGVDALDGESCQL